MKIKENVTLYICEHCKKEMKTLKGMARHERICNKNPLNVRICHGCSHLEEKEIEVTYFNYANGYETEHVKKAKSFYCNKLKVGVYPYVVERRGLQDSYPETFDEQVPMKKECKDFKPEWDDIDEMFKGDSGDN